MAMFLKNLAFFMGASGLPTLRLIKATHSSRHLEAFLLLKHCEWLVVNCNVGKRAPLFFTLNLNLSLINL